ncbi:16S rRNA (guanine(527)-N(7))-methyltransferase RsmG [Campylobacter sp. VBCF_06 NA8]|uniref:16S rRNA (guanine(527)-N(7))-methyltransferase RsmG n=1 Tax=Campylobacter sp. VBCF_06 NA8 TaxID=2983822 RepID=UPI003FA46C14
MNLILPENFDEKCDKFGECLRKFNAIHSLTNYDDLSEIIADSIGGVKFIPKYPKIAIDIGSGAGFPAIFLAMVLNHTKWHLYEPIAKKASFLTYAKVNLGLKNVEIHREKIENSLKFRADLITSRAVMKTKNLVEICDGFYDSNTHFLLYKGSNVDDEITEFRVKFTGAKTQVFNEENRNYLLISEISKPI